MTRCSSTRTRVCATFVWALVLAGAAIADAKPARLKSAFPARLTRAIQATLAAETSTSASVNERLERVTRPLVGVRYQPSPLGEEHPPDVDPKFRVDAFDCTTFVETAMAFGMSTSLEAAESVLQRIRYRGNDHRFSARRHLIEAQWIVDLRRDGLLEDITQSLFSNDARVAHVHVTPKAYARRRIAKQVILQPDAIPVGAFELPYVPLSAIDASGMQIPAATIVNVVREERDLAPTLVSHQALVLVRPNETARIVRHASPVAGRVVDEPFERFLKRAMNPRTERRWKVVGFNFLAIHPPPKKVSPRQ